MALYEDYLKNAKKQISLIPLVNEIEIIRWIYIDLGKMLNFDLNYTFGNSKEKNKIYETNITDEIIEEILIKRESICKGFAYLFARIMADLNIKADVAIDDENYDHQKNRHIHNTVILKNGIKCRFDLEEDLEYIKTKSITRNFALIEETNDSFISNKILKQIDIKIGYIEDFYLEEFLFKLKQNLEAKNISLEEKLPLILVYMECFFKYDNINYREITCYQLRILNFFLSIEDIAKISFVNGRIDNCYVTLLFLNKGNVPTLYFSDESFHFSLITMEEIYEKINKGLVLSKGIPGLKKYIKNHK